MAMYIKSNSGFWIHENSFFCDFTALKKISYISNVDWRIINATYSKGVLLNDFHALMPLVT